MPELRAVLKVKVVPGSSKDAIVGWMGDELRIKVMAPPEKGKANQAVIRLLAKALKLSRDSIQIVSGETSPHKQVEITGLSLDAVFLALGTGPGTDS
ncbi:MAG: DUF167 domain-containing protein [Gammaproteobacteria bacterium]|nr:DUF167 domain-containing protein [Gammaproteobacteria bacterium]